MLDEKKISHDKISIALSGYPPVMTPEEAVEKGLLKIKIICIEIAGLVTI